MVGFYNLPLEEASLEDARVVHLEESLSGGQGRLLAVPCSVYTNVRPHLDVAT